MKGEPFMPNTPKDPMKEPLIAKEKMMGGGRTEGVPEFEDLKQSLTRFWDAVNALRNFEMTMEWQNWKAYENQGQSPQREQARKAVMEKLAEIERTVDVGSQDAAKVIDFYRAEIERK